MVDGAAFDEMTTANGVRAPYGEIAEWLKIVVSGALRRRQSEADLLFRRLGITFAVYGEGGDPERLIPFDLIPRVLGHDEWTRLAGGLKQRVKALNAFIRDIYHDQEILKAGRIPADLVLKNAQYRSEMRGVAVTGDAYTTIAGIDLVRTGEDEFFVLEDNLRTPSGVSYMLENREAMMRLFPQLFARQRVAPVGHYPDELLQTLRSLAPETAEEDPTVVLMTPGAYNSAYFEHVFLAQQVGGELGVKEVHGSGGYGMLVGPKATKAEIEAYGARVKANPSGFIAQPTLALSTCPTLVEEGVAPRHVDLRPFVLVGKTIRLVPGGLTRVALSQGSRVVNSSQGGGTKDTWVLEA